MNWHIINETPNIMVPLFKSMMRPIIEYANVVWAPYLKKDIILIESFQRYFTKNIKCMKGKLMRKDWPNLSCLVYGKKDWGGTSLRYTKLSMLYMTQKQHTLCSQEFSLLLKKEKVVLLEQMKINIHSFLLMILIQFGTVCLTILWMHKV